MHPVQKFQHELSTKWVLNTVSTGAHVLLGKILQNHMLDLCIRNSKLFWRALAMLQVGGDGTWLAGAWPPAPAMDVCGAKV